MPQVNPGSRYRCGRSTQEQPVGPRQGGRGPEIRRNRDLFPAGCQADALEKCKHVFRLLQRQTPEALPGGAVQQFDAGQRAMASRKFRAHTLAGRCHRLSMSAATTPAKQKNAHSRAVADMEAAVRILSGGAATEVGREEADTARAELKALMLEVGIELV